MDNKEYQEEIINLNKIIEEFKSSIEAIKCANEKLCSELKEDLEKSRENLKENTDELDREKKLKVFVKI